MAMMAHTDGPSQIAWGYDLPLICEVIEWQWHWRLVRLGRLRTRCLLKTLRS
jgi:hypothetical protein